MRFEIIIEGSMLDPRRVSKILGANPERVSHTHGMLHVPFEAESEAAAHALYQKLLREYPTGETGTISEIRFMTTADSCKFQN